MCWLNCWSMKPPDLQREHPSFQDTKVLHSSPILEVILAFLHPDPDPKTTKQFGIPKDWIYACLAEFIQDEFADGVRHLLVNAEVSQGDIGTWTEEEWFAQEILENLYYMSRTVHVSRIYNRKSERWINARKRDETLSHLDWAKKYKRNRRSALVTELATGSQKKIHIKKEARKYSSLANHRSCTAG